MCTGWVQMNGPPCHTKFDLFSIVLGKSDETMHYVGACIYSENRQIQF